MSDAGLALVVATVAVIATLISPTIAVQVQRWLDETKEKKRRKLWIFATLMTTRATRTAQDHVMALNAIELMFNGDSEKDRAVVNSWRIYFDHLCNMPDEKEYKESQETLKMKLELWGQKSDDLFVDLLKSLSDALDYKFDKVQLKRGVYYPRAHGEVETELRLLRHALLNILYGKNSIPMDVTGFPGDPAAFDLQRKVNEAILKAYQDGVLQVVVKPTQEQ